MSTLSFYPIFRVNLYLNCASCYFTFVAKPISRSQSAIRAAANNTVISLNERKQALARETIWQAAIDLFTEKGFDETTLDDITAAAGTSRRSFFRYFESKSDLLVQPIVSYGNFITDAIRRCPANYSPAQVLRHTLLTVAENSASKPQTKQLIELAAKYPSARQAQIGRFAQVQDKVAQACAERFEEPTSRVLAALTHSLLSVSFQNWFEGDQKDIATDVEEVLETLREVACDRKAQVPRSRLRTEGRSGS